MLGWFKNKSAPGQSKGDEAFDRAMAESDDLLIKTRSVKQQLEPYRVADDPFAAIQRATSLDGLYG